MEFKGNKELKCSTGDSNKDFTLQPHQKFVLDHFFRSKKRGILFYHALGSGKTCSAYSAIEKYRKEKDQKRPVIVLAPASLASSHQHQYCKVCGETPSKFHEIFKFYSFNDRQGITKKLPNDLSNTIILVDEVQEILNGKANMSRSLSYVYDTILNAQNAKVILLSGTPCFKASHCTLLLNLLDPKITDLDPYKFLKDIQNPLYLPSKCKGLISYVPIPNKELYPSRVEPDIVDRFEMSPFQYHSYVKARTDEIEKRKDIMTKLKAAGRAKNNARMKSLSVSLFVNSAMIQSRQVCNFAYPDNIKILGKRVPVENDLTAKWIDDSKECFDNLMDYSPKMYKLLERCVTLDGKHMIYGWFKSRHGLYLIYRYLTVLGITPLLFSGDLTNDKQRTELIEKFNHENNKNGEIYKVILVSGAGAMGISLYGIRHFHNFESNINEFISIQAEGRAFRTMSHHQLPEDQRNVQVYRYFTILPRIDGEIMSVNEEQLSSEEIAYQKGLSTMKEAQYVLDIMKRSSIDCHENYNKNITNCINYIEDEFELHVMKEDQDFTFGNDGFGGELVKSDTSISMFSGDELPFNLSIDEHIEIEKKSEDSTSNNVEEIINDSEILESYNEF